LAENLYEAMFLVDAAKGGEGFPAVIQHISGLLERNGAQAERIEKWAESKLAYEIKHVDRGVYVLVYFRAASESISPLRRDIGLSEELLRALILRAEEIPEARGKLYTTQGEPLPEEAEPAEPESEPTDTAEPTADTPEPAAAAEPESSAEENT
jgi:small subunit ribosomal protein S6